MWCGLCGFLIIEPQTILHHVVWCGAGRLCHFAGDFGAVFVVCAVYAIWWTPLHTTTNTAFILLPFHSNILILLFLLSLSFTLSNFHLNNIYIYIYIYIFQCFHHRATVKCQICSKVLKFWLLTSFM